MPENLQEMPMDPSIGAAAMAAPPASPGEVSVLDPSMMGGEAQVNPEEEAGMRFDLERMLGKIKDKNTAFEEKQALSSEKLEGFKSRVVKEIFGLMKELGVDPSDLGSINEFLQKLQQQDPDLYIMFESAIGSLSPGMEATPGPMPVPGMETAPGPIPAPGMETVPIEEGERSLMENNTANLQENILRQ